MRVRIHRGAREVGGSCVELEAAGRHILLDAGSPLASDPLDEARLPEVAETGDPSLLGVFVSHAHPDHFGLLGRVADVVPTCIGKDAIQILSAASFYTDREPPRISDFLEDGVTIEVGPFCVTPYLVDHSAYDAYSLLVEADGSRLFYTADLRAHGRKPGAFARLLERPPRNVDALLLEGTTVGRASWTGPANEAELEYECALHFHETKGMALACYSPQNLDRMVTAYRAALQADRDLVMDLYTADVACASNNDNIPQADWERVRVYVPNSQRVRVKESEEFWRVERRRETRIFVEELASDPGRWVLTFRTSMAAELDRANCLDGARALWMMWPGYLDQPGDRTRATLERLGIVLDLAHTSGHASVRDLQRLAKAIAADKVVPIHTGAPYRFPELFDNVHLYDDGVWWEI